MIVTQEKKDVKKSHQFETVNYGVSTDNLPMLFQMLRTNLYSDIHGSIIREVVSNVIDSHTEAGKPNAIGEVEWIDENRLLGVNNQLIIRDFGVGLSPDRMKNVYGNYLSSTKREDNSAIGGFGLGSKVPFAYTDSFFVSTVYDKKQYKYLCYIDETQLGAISTLEVNDTTKENGTEIIIPVKDRNDKQRFQSAIFRQLSYLKNIKYINFNEPKNDILFENEHCIIGSMPPYDDLHIVLGNVAYPIDFQALTGNTSMWGNPYFRCRVGLKFGIGELQPTLSRESLFWTEVVKKKVLDKIKKAQKSIRTEIEKELNEESDYCKWYVTITHQSSQKFPSQWSFCEMKTSSMYDPKDKSTGKPLLDKPLRIDNRLETWFSGLVMRTVSKPGFSRKKIKSEYSTSATYSTQLKNLPIYYAEGALSSRKNLFLFEKHPSGFIVVNNRGIDELSDADKERAKPFYDNAESWCKTLQRYDDVEVPADKYSEVNDEEYKLNYKKILAQRKLEGKFTAKTVIISNPYSRNTEDMYAFQKYEGKFEEHKKDLIIYGTQEEDKSLLKIASILSTSKKFAKNDVITNVRVLKVSQQNLKHFDQMANAHEITQVLNAKTPMNEEFANIVTAHKYKDVLMDYKILEHFGNLNSDLQKKYMKSKAFVELHTDNKRFGDSEYLPEIIKLCDDNGICNKEQEESFEEYAEYFSGVEVLKFVQYDPSCEKSIKDLLMFKGKGVQVDRSTIIRAVSTGVTVNDKKEVAELV